MPEEKSCDECGAALPMEQDPCVECGSTRRINMQDLQGCRACSRSFGGRGRRAGYGLLSVFVAASVFGSTFDTQDILRQGGCIRDPEVSQFLDALPSEGWWDYLGGKCHFGVSPGRACEPPEKIAKSCPFLTVVCRGVGQEWIFWGTVDKRRHKDSLMQWEDLRGQSVCVFFTKKGPLWAGWLKGSATSGLGTSRGLSPLSRDTVRNPCLHIIESVDMERMGEETPTDYYYEVLRKELGRKYPGADPFLLDHLVSLEGFLDKSIIFGFSFGIAKAELCVTKGKLLGHIIGRDGSSPDPERCQAVVDFPPLKEKLHIQQFLGCSNWLRSYLPAEYGHVAKVLGAYQKPGSTFPEGGLGSGSSEGCKAVRTIKRMICDHISLAVFDESSAADGSCPLEQIADASGIAVGGTVLQMSRDLSRMKILMTHSKSLTPAQQNWPPLIQEAFAQLEVKRATRRVFGTIKTLCWTDHANLTRSQTNNIGVDAKLVRWIAELLADGSELRSLSGRSARLGDGYSRNPKERDELLEARTKDLSGMAGQLRDFNMDEYLGDGTEGDGPVPWAVGDDAVPDSGVPNTGIPKDKVALAGPLERIAAVAANVKVLVVMDYARQERSNLALGALARQLERALPGGSIQLRACYGPFEDDEGLASHFDGAVGRLTGPKKVKRMRVDTLTSCAKVLRDAASFLPDLVVGFGQGAVISALVRWPLMVEVTLQARNLQNKEVQKVGAAWGGIKGIWVVDPRVWKSKLGAEDVLSACPELRKSFPVDPLKGFGVATKQGRPDESTVMLETLRVARVDGIDAVNIRAMLADPPREMWEHEGVCVCGRRTYLFARCPACIERESAEELDAVLEDEHAVYSPEEDEKDEGIVIDVMALTAATEGTGGVKFIPWKVLESWGKAGRQVQHSSHAEVKFGFLSVCKWKSVGEKLSLGKADPNYPYITTWVVTHKGWVLAGHSCCREEISKPRPMLWHVSSVNWHNHRHLVTETCKELWSSRQVEHLSASFRRLVGLLGVLERVEGWDDSRGEEALGHRNSLKYLKVLVCFQETASGYWDEIVLSKKIRVDESGQRRTLAFVGHEDPKSRVVLCLRSKDWILTDWNGQVQPPTRICLSDTAVSEAALRRETLAEAAREEAGISEFRVSGSLRCSWHEAQRKDESLAGQFKKTLHPFVLAGDGLLEREVQLKTGQVLQVPVVPNGIAAANGLTWRKACYNAVHGGVLGAHRSAQVTCKLLERAVWWPLMKEDVERWVGSCLSCLKGRSRPTRVEAKAVKCTASTCWEEVSVDCEGPNKEDRDGYRYSLTYFCCLSHAVMLEPLKALTHGEVRKAFTKCILRSRTIPSLIRSDRGSEFKNALMNELTALLGIQQRFSMALRPCEMGSNERVHQEVQKTLGALVRELGVAENWSDWLIVAEFVIDTTPGPHGYAPRDLERSWSLALPLEKDVLRDSLQFEPISDWAKKQFSQFKEIAQAVAKHWDRASEARARLANRFRRSVDLKVGERVVWKSPSARPEGAGRVPWRPGLNGPWEIVDVRGHRLWLEPVSSPFPGSSSDPPRRRFEAHAEDCVLVPADSPAESREPVVFEEPQDDAPSLGQQISGEAKQVEFTVQRRGRQFVLRIGERIAYRRGPDPKVCFLGRVTQVDVAQAQVSVHRYLPDVSGLRVKWQLAYLDEEGQMGLEGTRPALEPVSIKEVICKVDLSRDGILAAGSARKLDKGGYSLRDRVSRSGPCSSTGGPSLFIEVFTELLSVGSPRDFPSLWKSVEGAPVLEWLEHNKPGRIQFWETFAGQAGLTFAARQQGLATAPPLDKIYHAFGRMWDLSSTVDQELFWSLYDVLRPEALHAGLPCEHYSIAGLREPDETDQVIQELTVRVLLEQEKRGARGTAENPVTSLLWQSPKWVAAFGPLIAPLFPWQFVATDACQYGMESRSLSDGSYGQPVKKGQVWMANYCMSGFSLRCHQPDTLGIVDHPHRHVRGSVKVEVSGGTRWMGCGILSKE